MSLTHSGIGPRVIFCTTCKGRAQHVKITLPKNLADNTDHANCAFVVLNYNSQDDLLNYLYSHHAADIASGRLIVYSHFDAPAFRMAHAKNLAHRCGILEGADILVNLDADQFTGPGFARYIADKFKEEDIFLWSKMVFDGPDRTPRGISGRIAVSREAFLNVGGYDEKYQTWSPDDKDFNQRLRNLGYSAHEIDRRFLDGVLHCDKMRFREYPEAATAPGEDDFENIRYQRETIANWGRVGCGRVYRDTIPCRGNRRVVDLRPIPTRIFGIGLHKTGTTSLHFALKLLGFPSAHWKSAHWAKAIWEQVKAAGRSWTLEKHYALCDLPIALLYRELDAAYPGSKFILTTRNEQKWLASVENHWSFAHNQFRGQWDSDPFTHKVHLELYGRRKFDAGVFLERFRRHNAEVAEYFQDRPGDLLTINVDAPGGPQWAPLCEFLDRTVPATEYPKAYKTPLLFDSKTTTI